MTLGHGTRGVTLAWWGQPQEGGLSLAAGGELPGAESQRAPRTRGPAPATQCMGDGQQGGQCAP